MEVGTGKKFFAKGHEVFFQAPRQLGILSFVCVNISKTALPKLLHYEKVLLGQNVLCFSYMESEFLLPASRLTHFIK